MIFRKKLICCLPFFLIGLLVSSVSEGAQTKPRLIVLTDITSVKSGVREPDDAQSMIRLMLYSNEFDIEGLIASSGLTNGQVVRPENIRKIVDAYAKDRSNLASNSSGYPTAAHLRQGIKRGQPIAGPDVPVKQSIGEGKDTPASRWIIQKVDEPAQRPLWITIWGGSADLAQALFDVRQARSPQEVARFVSKIRVVASDDQDSTGLWIKSEFPRLFYITRKAEGRGVYRQGDQSLVSSEWVQENIKGHGALGDLYPDYQGGDIYSYKLGPVTGVKEGDSADFLGLIRNGLNVRGHLTWENWGGRIQQDAGNRRHFVDAIDPVGNYQTDISPYLAAVYRWRPNFQANYAARFEWAIKPYSQANHAPIDASGTAISHKNITAGERVQLQSGSWRDPDGNRLTYHWQVLQQEQTYPDSLAIENPSAPSTQFVAPSVTRPQTIHVLLTVTDDYYPSLSSYKRFIFIVSPQ